MTATAQAITIGVILVAIGFVLAGALGVFVGRFLHEGTRDLDGAAELDYSKRDHRP